MKTNDILWWVVVDGKTGEPVMQCASRMEARRIASTSDGRIAKVVLTK